MYNLRLMELLVIGVILLFLIGVPVIVVAVVMTTGRKRAEPPVASNLIPCPDCGHGCSQKTDRCPECGRPLDV